MLNLTTEAVRIKGNTSLASEKTLDSIKKILSNYDINTNLLNYHQYYDY